MKKVLVSLIFIYTFLYSVSSESKIVKLLFSSLFNSTKINIYVDDKKKYTIIKEAGFNLVKTCSKADLVYSSSYLIECNNKPIFTDNYKSFRDEKNVIGAFYWKKGRPNILFLKPRLDSFELKLPEKLEKYQIDEL